jgi:UDP-N-acetylmuramoylalanine--D-glutamate ligase
MLSVPEFLRPVIGQNTPVAVLGAGVSGRALAALLGKLGAASVLYDEQNAPGAPGASAGFAPERHALVLFSPGFRPDHPWLAAARAAGALTLGELDFASLFWRGSIIAVTGTNGKTTLASFLAHALRSLKKDAAAAGNIGVPLAALAAARSGAAPESVAVCEVSSFQAETLRHFRADASLWTNFAEDHLERHRSLENYFNAKWRLFERTAGGPLFAGSGVRAAAALFGQSLPDDACVPTENQPGDLLLKDTPFEQYPQRENFLLAAAWWRRAGLPEMALYAAARSFRLPPHRLARVAVVNGTAFWNDSKATNFHAAEAALRSFPAPVHLILGGLSKGGDLPAFVRRAAPRVRHAWLIGATAPALADACRAAAVPHTVAGTLDVAVRFSAAAAGKGGTVLLAPAFASFDQFKGCEERGERFIALVKSLENPIVPPKINPSNTHPLHHETS